ncbi:hypothetical protein AAMO2058_001644700 [Amorphochlora amoebiformis]
MAVGASRLGVAVEEEPHTAHRHASQKQSSDILQSHMKLKSRTISPTLILLLFLPFVLSLQNIQAEKKILHELEHELQETPRVVLFSSPENIIDERGAEQERCRLLANAFDYAVQGVLGILAFSTLVIKFSFEKSDRELRSFLFDTAKQASSGVTIHFFNIFLAKLLIWGRHHTGSLSADECDVYFVNFLLDILAGMVLVWLLLIPYHMAVDRYKLSSRKCGDYGYPGEMKPFLLQLWGFSLLMVLVKVLLSVIEWVFVDEINFLGHSMFFYLDAFPKTKLLVIMIIAPFVCNVFFFWVVDTLIQHQPDETQGSKQGTPSSQQAIEEASHKNKNKAPPAIDSVTQTSIVVKPETAKKS